MTDILPSDLAKRHDNIYYFELALRTTKTLDAVCFSNTLCTEYQQMTQE